MNIFKTYGTAQIKTGELEVEFVGARKESYSPESRNPAVSKGSIEDDQRRRDLTINAMSMRIDKDHFGEVMDPFHGLKDLENKIIRTPLGPRTDFQR